MSRRYQTDNNSFYHSQAWQTVREQVLARDGYRCQVCKRAGRLTPATTVHHLKSVRQAPALKLDPANLECICRSCHNAEHTERAQALKTKQSKIKASKRRGVKVIKASPEVW